MTRINPDRPNIHDHKIKTEKSKSTKSSTVFKNTLGKHPELTKLKKLNNRASKVKSSDKKMVTELVKKALNLVSGKSKK